MKWLRETENRVENEYLRQESLSTGALVTAEAKTSATWERKNIRGWFPRIFGEANLSIFKCVRICISANLENIEITYDTVTAVRRRCTDWYEIWALTDHEIYYIKIELNLRKFSNGPFSETEKGFWVIPTPGGSQCTGVSPTLSWKWPRATLSPSFGPFFERNHSFGVKMVS